MTHALPVHPHHRHPLTGQPIVALGYTSRGALIWPQMGGDDTVPPAGAPGTGQTGDGQQGQQQQGQPANQGASGDGFDTLPESWQKEIKKLRDDAAKARTSAKETAAQEARTALTKEFAKILGLEGDNTPPDPAALTKQLEQQRAAAQEALAEAYEYRVYRMALKAGANAERLLDSRAFITAIDNLDVDPDDTDAFRTAIEAEVKKALDADPGLRANPGTSGAARQGADHSGGGTSGGKRPTSIGAAISKAYAGR